MSQYRHKKGIIKDNAIKALLHDPLFRQRKEQNKKGKGSYQRIAKYGKRGNWEAGGKEANSSLSLSVILCNCQRIKGDRSVGHRTR